MLCTRCLRSSLGGPLRPRIALDKSIPSGLRQQPLRTPSSPRNFSLLSSHRPRILANVANAPQHTTTTPTTLTPQLDLLPKISTHPSLAGIQVRNGPRDTFNPSHRVRKRRHGFLSRIKTRKGRNTLTRRKVKGRSRLSH